MVRKVRELGDFESSYEVPRIEGLKAPVEYERLAVEPQHFFQCFETFLKCADTPDFDCPKRRSKVGRAAGSNT